jgi:hypothetical protein
MLFAVTIASFFISAAAVCFLIYRKHRPNIKFTTFWIASVSPALSKDFFGIEDKYAINIINKGKNFLHLLMAMHIVFFIFMNL